MKKLLPLTFLLLIIISCKKDNKEVATRTSIDYEISGASKFTFTVVVNKTTKTTVWNETPSQTEQSDASWIAYGSFVAEKGDTIYISTSHYDGGITKVKVQNQTYSLLGETSPDEADTQFVVK